MKNRLSFAAIGFVLVSQALVAQQALDVAEANWRELMMEGAKLRDQARYADAERCFRSVVEASERFGAMGPHHADSLNSLGIVVQIRGRYDEAESLFRQAIVI